MKKSPQTSGLNIGLKFYVFIVLPESVPLQLVCLHIEMKIDLKTEYDWEKGLIQMSYIKSKQKY